MEVLAVMTSVTWNHLELPAEMQPEFVTFLTFVMVPLLPAPTTSSAVQSLVEEALEFVTPKNIALEMLPIAPPTFTIQITVYAEPSITSAMPPNIALEADLTAPQTFMYPINPKSHVTTSPIAPLPVIVSTVDVKVPIDFAKEFAEMEFSPPENNVMMETRCLETVVHLLVYLNQALLYVEQVLVDVTHQSSVLEIVILAQQMILLLAQLAHKTAVITVSVNKEEFANVMQDSLELLAIMPLVKSIPIAMDALQMNIVVGVAKLPDAF